MINIAFDVDDTLWKVRWELRNGIAIPCGQIPDYEVIHTLIFHYKNGEKIYVWSAGGVDYARSVCEKLGLSDMVEVVRKDQVTADALQIDLTYDDQEVTLGKVNIRIHREYRMEE
jgi:phosphoglycolate phosphatase-like HAD superfamily hydrolase